MAMAPHIPPRPPRRLRAILGGLVILALGAVVIVPRLRAVAPRTRLPLVSVRTGSLAVTVAATGQVMAPAPVDLVFPVSGELGRLDVTAGELVRAGQVVAGLNTVSLFPQISEARATLAQALAKYQATAHPLTPAQIAADRAQVASARTALASARSVLSAQAAAYRDTLPSQGAVLAARTQERSDLAQIKNDRALLTQAEAKLTQAKYPTPPAQIAAAQTQVKNAALAVQRARTLLADQQALAGDTLPAQAQVLQARSQLNSALDAISSDQAALAKAQAALALATESAHPDQVSAAQAQIQAATTTVQILQSELANDESMASSDAETVATDQSLQQTALENLSVAQAVYAKGGGTLLQLENVASAATSAENQLAAAIAASNQTQNQVLGVQNSLGQAQAAQAQAEANLSNLQGQPDPNTVSEAQDAVTQAQDAYQAARSAYGIAQQELANAKRQAANHAQAQLSVAQAGSALTSAKNAYASARAALAAAVAPSPSAQIDGAKAAVLEATDALWGATEAYHSAQAELAYQKRLAGDRTQANVSLTQAMASVRGAQASLAEQKAQLASTTGPVAPDVLAQAAAAVALARAQLAAVEVTASEALLRSPVAGQVLGVNVVAGQAVSPADVVAVIDPAPDTPQVQALLSTADIAKVHAGELAQVTTSAYPGRVFPGRVVSVTPQAETVSGVQLYPVTLSVDPAGSSDPSATGRTSRHHGYPAHGHGYRAGGYPAHAPGRASRAASATAAPAGTLLPGLPVNVSIVSRSLNHVLLLPVTAVVQSPSGQAAVLIPARKGFVRHPVVEGATNGLVVQVRSGLASGERVSLYAQPQALFGGGQARPSGGFGGRGGLGGFGG